MKAIRIDPYTATVTEFDLPLPPARIVDGRTDDQVHSALEVALGTADIGAETLENIAGMAVHWVVFDAAKRWSTEIPSFTFRGGHGVFFAGPALLLGADELFGYTDCKVGRAEVEAAVHFIPEEARPTLL